MGGAEFWGPSRPWITYPSNLALRLKALTAQKVLANLRGKQFYCQFKFELVRDLHHGDDEHLSGAEIRTIFETVKRHLPSGLIVRAVDIPPPTVADGRQSFQVEVIIEELAKISQ